ncbi:hypothetical protein JCM17823_17400 [Halorubrum gandharaense]
MGLRCLLGHDFDEPELEREREENGDEVVITVREVKTCTRCGEKQVVSENKEVTTIEQLADEAAVADAQAEAEAEVRADAVDRGAESDESSASAADDMGAAGLTQPTGSTASDDATIVDAETAEAVDEGGADVDAELLDEGPDETEPTAERESAEMSDEPAEATETSEDISDDEGVELLGGGDTSTETDDETLVGADDLASPEEAATGTADAAGDEPAAGFTEPDEGVADAAEDDGVILDEDGSEVTDDDDRQRGAWPEVEGDEAPEGESTPWPEHGDEDEGFSAETDSAGTASDAGVSFGGGLTPESADQPADDPTDEDAEVLEAPAKSEPRTGDAESGSTAASEPGTGESTDADADVGSGITRSESPELTTSMGKTETEYHCPECGMTRDADATSMRAGDICPECKRGYVTERSL